MVHRRAIFSTAAEGGEFPTWSSPLETFSEGARYAETEIYSPHFRDS
jgi:hypothetical protein